MTDNKYQYFSQKRFNGGIETRDEYLKPNQVLDARNYWSPLGEMEQRPGVCAALVNLLNVDSTVAPTTVVFSDVSAGTDALLTPGVSSLNALAYGDRITFHYVSPVVGIDRVGMLDLSSTAATNLITKTRTLVEFWTSRGWVVGYAGWFRAHPSLGSHLEPFLSGPGQAAMLASPADILAATKTFTTGNLTGYFIRVTLTSATTTAGVPITAGTTLGATAGTLTPVKNTRTGQINPAARNLFAGVSFLKYNTGNLVVSLVTNPIAGSTFDSDAAQVIVSTATSLRYNHETSYTKYSNDFIRPQLPPTFAVVPEFNTAFIGFCNRVFEVPFYGSRSQLDTYPLGTVVPGPLMAQINTDPNIVGPISVSNPFVPYSTDLVPQLTAFPAANLIVYLKNQLWAAGIQGIGNLIRWSGSSTDGAYNVWPEDNQVTLSTAKDNSEITALSPLGDNLVVFKKNSIWQMIDLGDDPLTNLPLYEPRLVVAGIGTVSHSSVQAVEGGLIFLAEDGFYLYDGTPNIRRISDPIKPYIDRINAARSPFAVATVWRSKQVYMCAVSLDGEDQANNYVFVYDFQNDAWWVWNGWDVQCWFQVDGVGLQEEVWYTDSFGRAYKLGAWTQSDNGAEIDSWFLTGRLGFDDVVTKTSRELRVRGIANNPDVTYNVIGDDIEINTPGSATYDPVTTAITMPRDTEAQYESNPAPVYGEAVYVPGNRRRERKSPNRTTASWFQVKIRKMLKVFGVDLGFEQEGRR